MEREILQLYKGGGGGRGVSHKPETKISKVFKIVKVFKGLGILESTVVPLHKYSKLCATFSKTASNEL